MSADSFRHWKQEIIGDQRRFIPIGIFFFSSLRSKAGTDPVAPLELECLKLTFM